MIDFKSFTSKAWLFVKSNWLAILSMIIVSLLAFQVATIIMDVETKNTVLKKLLGKEQERTTQSIADVTKSFNEQLAAQQETQRQFEQRLNEIDLKYQQQLSLIQTKQKQTQRRLIENPSEIPGVITSVFGIPERSSTP